MSTKIICDLCGKDAIGYKFIIPEYDELLVKNKDVVITTFKQGIVPQKMNLCHSCQRIIADIIYEMKNHTR